MSLPQYTDTETSLVPDCPKSLLQQNHSMEQLLRVWSCISGGKLETPAIVFLFWVFVSLFVFVKYIRKQRP